MMALGITLGPWNYGPGLPCWLSMAARMAIWVTAEPCNKGPGLPCWLSKKFE